MIQPREIPVYLFTGFLESGKTTFIQETLEDPAFNEGQKTLLLVCEEGEIEYSPIKFASSNVKIVTVDEEEELTGEFLQKLRDEIGFERVVCEFNGMWSLDSLYSSMPDGWTVYQEMSFADARTYLTYNQNMRNLTVDKLKSTETIVFKHFTQDMDKMAYHKIVRAINRRCDIIYEYGPNNIEIDNIEDPLPFDINADIIEIGPDENMSDEMISWMGDRAGEDGYGEQAVAEGHHQQAGDDGGLVLLRVVGNEATGQAEHVDEEIEHRIDPSGQVVGDAELGAQEEEQDGVHDVVAEALAHVGYGGGNQALGVLAARLDDVEN